MLPSLLINPLHYISAYITQCGSFGQTSHSKVVSQLVGCGPTRHQRCFWHGCRQRTAHCTELASGLELMARNRLVLQCKTSQESMLTCWTSLHNRPTVCVSLCVLPWGLTLAVFVPTEQNEPSLSALFVASWLYQKHLIQWYKEDESTRESRLLLDSDHVHNITTSSIKPWKCLRRNVYFDSHERGVGFSVAAFQVWLLKCPVKENLFFWLLIFYFVTTLCPSNA